MARPAPGDAARRGPIADTLRTPGVSRTLLTSLVARLPFAAVTVLLLLRTRDLGGTYAAAGLVVTAYAAVSGITEPLIARLADRRGQTPVLAVTIPLNAAAFGLAAAAASPGVLALAGALIGASYPQVGGMARTLLVELLPDERRRTAGFALETGSVEVLFISAPAIFVGGVAGHAGTSNAFIAAAALAAAGSTWFAMSPASRQWRPNPHLASGPVRLATPAYCALVAVVFGLGCTLGTIDVALTAFAEHQGTRAAVGWLLALSAAGSLAGGLAVARLPPPGSATRRLALLLALLLALQAATTLLLVIPASLPAMAAAVTVNGLTVAPAMATVFSLVAAAVPRGRLTEGFAWLGTGLMVGAALGAALGGALLTHAPADAAFAVAAFPLVVAALAAAARRSEPVATDQGPQRDAGRIG